MEECVLIERMATVKELTELRRLAGWGIPEAEALKLGLDNSLYGICAFIGEDIVGTARIIGDRSTCFYIQDVIVHPKYQRRGIGLSMMGKLMEYISKSACDGAVVGLMSAKGKEQFYERFGFWTRPNDHFGHGMMQFWKKA
jgi:predicted N-acetyltransferase YhbS